MSFCENRMNGTNYPAITPGDLVDFKIPIYSYLQQVTISGELNLLDKAVERTEKQILSSQQIKQELINKIF